MRALATAAATALFLVGLSLPSAPVAGQDAAALPVQPSAAALQQLGRMPRRGGVAALRMALQGGLNDELTGVALAALGQQGGEDAVAELTRFTDHRRVEARLAAYQALAQAGGEAATGGLLRGLSDVDARVRERCAQLLREVAAPTPQVQQAIRAALQRGIAGSAATHAHIAPAATLLPLAPHLTRVDGLERLAAYKVALVRRDLTKKQRVSLVAEVVEIGTPAARDLLVSLLRTPVAAGDEQLRGALLAGIRQLSPAESAP